MILYTSVDLSKNPLPIKTFTMAAGMDGFTILNFSPTPIQLTSQKVGDLGSVPPLFSKSVNAKANDVIEVKEADYSTNALSTSNAFIELTQQSGTVPSLVPLSSLPGYTLPIAGSVYSTIQNSEINSNVVNAVQTNALVSQGTATINVSDLADTESISQTLQGIATGYYETLVAEGTSKNGYTYLLSASAFNRSTNVGSFTLTQSDGPNGEFYATGNLSARQSFANVSLTLQAQVSSPSSIFTDPMTANTNWTIQSGSATFGASGASLTATGTILTENTLTTLEPQNLTLQSQFKVENSQSSTTYTAYNQTSTNSSSGNSPTYDYAWTLQINNQFNLTGIGIYVNTGGKTITCYLWNNYGTLLLETNITTVSWSNGFSIVNFSPITLTAGTYYVSFYDPQAADFWCENTGADTTIQGGNVTVTVGTVIYQINNGGFPGNSTTTYSGFSVDLLLVMNEVIGSHTTAGVLYYQTINTFYLLEWNSGTLEMIKKINGTQTILASTSTNESSTNVTLKLVVASNGNLTGTMTGSTTTTVSATDTTITSGALGVYGDSGAVASQAFISGNYVPRDTVTVNVYTT